MYEKKATFMGFVDISLILPGAAGSELCEVTNAIELLFVVLCCTVSVASFLVHRAEAEAS
jgi:hypothetical protein